MIAMGVLLSIAAAGPAVGLQRPAAQPPLAPMAARLRHDALVVIKDLADPSELAGPQRAIFIKPEHGPAVASPRGGSGIV